MTGCRWFGIALLTLLLLNNGLHAAKKKLYIGALLPMSAAPGGFSHYFGLQVLPAVEIALQIINDDPDILPDYELVLVWKDTQENAAIASKAFFDLIYEAPTKIMLLGPLMDKCVVNVASSTPAWNLVMITTISRTPEMNERTRFPMIFRTMQEDSNFNEARLRFIQHFHWKRVAIFYTSHSVNIYFSSAQKLTKLLINNNITVVSLTNVENDPTKAVEDLKKNDVRIIIGSYYTTFISKMFCEAFKAGVYGGKYVWIHIGWLSQASLDKHMKQQDCEYEDVKKAADGSFYFDNPELRMSENDTIYGMSLRDFETRYLNATSYSTVSEKAVYGFDTMLSIAHTLHQADNNQLPLDKYTYDNSTYAEEFLRIIHGLHFNGLTGPVSFDEFGNRVGITEITQLQGNVRKHVADHYPFETNLRLSNPDTIIWKDNEVPLDGKKKDILVLYIPDYAFYPLALLSVFGVMLASGFLFFNIKKRDLKFIKLSSPAMNNLIAVGCILSYVAVILLGLDSRFVSTDFFTINCKFRIWVLSCAFSLAFGAMFSKTWRVHVIMSQKTKQKVVVTDWHLAVKVLALVTIDSIFLALWTGVDPFVSFIKSFPEIVDPMDDNHVWLPEVAFCHSSYEVYWIGGIIVYKGLLLMLGLFLAWETRNVRIDALNDSKHIGMCVYNVALMCVMGVPVGFLVGDEKFVGGYVITSLFIILSTTITLCLVFVPKIIELRKNPLGEVNISINPNQTRFTTSSSNAKFKIAPLEGRPSTSVEPSTLSRTLEECERKLRYEKMNNEATA